MAEALSSGEISAATFVQPQVDEKEAGAPVEWGLANPAWGARFQGTLLKSGPHPNAAQVLADFMITKDGQAAIARKNAAVLPDVPGAVAEIANVRKPVDHDSRSRSRSTSRSSTTCSDSPEPASAADEREVQCSVARAN